MPLFITTTNKDIAVNSFKTRGYPIGFNKSTDYREIYIVDPSNATKYIYDGHGTRMTIGAQNNTGGRGCTFVFNRQWWNLAYSI